MVPYAYASSYVPPSSAFTRTLQAGSSGNDVKALQQFLNTNGFIVSQNGAGSPGNETYLFGGMTKSSLARFQDVNAAAILSPQGLTKGSGVLGLSTRSFINALMAVPSVSMLSATTSSFSDSNDGLPPYVTINHRRFYKTDPGGSLPGYMQTTAGWVKITSGVGDNNTVVQSGGDAPSAPVGPPQIAVSYALGSGGVFGDYTPINSGDTIPGFVSSGQISIRIVNTGEGPLSATMDPPLVMSELSSAERWDAIIQPGFPIAPGDSQDTTLSASSYNSETSTLDIYTNDPTNPDFSIVIITNS